MKCFYHIDEDGKCAAFWVNKLARHYDGYEKEFIPINYGMDFPFDIIHQDEQIYIVDFSILPEQMEQLLKVTENVPLEVSTNKFNEFYMETKKTKMGHVLKSLK